MSGWAGSDRRQRLPKDWATRRRRVLRRDGNRCAERDQYGERCSEQATEVDHIEPGDDHRESNLRALCSWHHQRKSSREGGQARAIQRRKSDQKFRRTEPHPGLL